MQTDILFDSDLLFKIFALLSSGVLLAILGFIIVGFVAFYKNNNSAARTFIELFLQ